MISGLGEKTGPLFQTQVCPTQALCKDSEEAASLKVSKGQTVGWLASRGEIPA